MTLEEFEYNFNPDNSTVLADLWPDFIGDPSIRWGAERDLILSVFDEVTRDIPDDKRYVLECCAGLGIEVINLARERCAHILANEYDTNLMTNLKENVSSAADLKSKVDFSSMEWLSMGEMLREDRYLLMLCLGNSIGYCRTKDDQLGALSSFNQIIHPEGRMILDVRNWEGILNSAKPILAEGGELNRDNHRFSGYPMYNGDVSGFPVAIYENWIKYRYTLAGDDREGFLAMSTTNVDELSNMASDAGFKKIEIYSDFTEGKKPHANFYQLVMGK